jgi:cytoskeletal protein CcmA (bactofilin family)
MGATYTRQSTYTDGDVIQAADTNDEFNQLLAAFASSTGHTHDGTAAEGGPVTKLLGNTLTFGAGTAGTDITITFDGETSDGVMYWMEDEDHFKFADDIVVDSTKRLYFNDEGGEYIYGDGTDLYLTSGADINIPANIGLTFGDDGEKIEGDGTDLTIAGNNINLTAVADVNIPSGVGLTFATAEKIESDGTDLSITVGSGGDINIPADIGVTFGNDGEKIEGDGTDLTITGNNINLTATADIVVPADVGITFGSGEKIEGDSTDLTVTSGAKINLTATSDVVIPSGVGLILDGSGNEKIESDGTDISISVGSGGDINVPANIGVTFGDDGEKIEGDGTDLTIASSAKLNLTATSDIHVPNNVGIVFGGDSEKIEGDGTDLTISANNLTVDAAADITLDAGDADVVLKDDGTQYAAFTNSSGNLIVKSGSTTMLTGSGANATFAGNVTVDGNLDVTGTFDLSDSDFTNAGDIQLDSITGDGDTNTSITFSGSDVITITAGGDTQFTFNNGSILPTTDNDIDLGSGSYQFKDLYINGTANLDAVDIDSTVQIDGATTFGVDDTGVDVKLFGATSGSFMLWDESADSLLLTDSTPIKMGDGTDFTLYHDGSNSYITNSTGALKIATETSGIAVTIGHTTSETTIADNLSVTGDIDVDGTTNLDAVDIDGNVQADGTVTVGVDDTGYDVKFFGDTASRYWLWDTSADGVVQRGTLTVGVDDTGHDVKFFGATSGKYMEWDESADQLDVTGSFDVTGNSTMVGTLTVGVDDTGHDVKFFGATSGQYMLWDESADELVLAGDSKLSFNDAAGGENIIASSDGHLEINAGTTLDITAATTQVNASTLFDVNGDADISGTLGVTGVATLTATPIANAGITVKNGSTSAGYVEFYEDSDNGTNKVTLIGPASTSDITLTLPSTAGTVATEAAALNEAVAMAIALG